MEKIAINLYFMVEFNEYGRRNIDVMNYEMVEARKENLDDSLKITEDVAVSKVLVGNVSYLIEIFALKFQRAMSD